MMGSPVCPRMLYANTVLRCLMHCSHSPGTTCGWRTFVAQHGFQPLLAEDFSATNMQQ